MTDKVPIGMEWLKDDDIDFILGYELAGGWLEGMMNLGPVLLLTAQCCDPDGVRAIMAAPPGLTNEQLFAETVKWPRRLIVPKSEIPDLIQKLQDMLEYI